jgi:hypothetical protein
MYFKIPCHNLLEESMDNVKYAVFLSMRLSNDQRVSPYAVIKILRCDNRQYEQLSINLRENDIQSSTVLRLLPFKAFLYI